MEVLAEVDAPNLHLQFDAFHAARMTGDVLGTWNKVRARVAHVQVAGVPNRREPCSGDFDYAALFRVLDKQNYKGWASRQYHPKDRRSENLFWIN